MTAAELRKYNDFFGDRFELCEVLRIPVKGREPHVLKNRQVGQDTRLAGGRQGRQSSLDFEVDRLKVESLTRQRAICVTEADTGGPAAAVQGGDEVPGRERGDVLPGDERLGRQPGRG